MAWMWWVVAALLLGIVEVLSLSLVLAMVAGGALAAALVSLTGAPWWAQWLTTAVVSAVLLVVLRPWLLRHLRRRVPLKETNAAALVGQSAVVVSAVDSATGRVKIGGDVWSARVDAEATLPPGTLVRVSRIDGAITVVVPLDAPDAR